MNQPNIRGLGLVQDGFTTRGKATGEVQGIGCLEALQAQAAQKGSGDRRVHHDR
jgi:hypothetical protein